MQWPTIAREGIDDDASRQQLDMRSAPLKHAVTLQAAGHLPLAHQLKQKESETWNDRTL